MNKEIIVSPLNKTWIFDIDGTVVKHNGYKDDGYDTLLDGAKDFFDSIDKDDMIVFITSRKEEYKESTIRFLNENGIRYDSIVFNAPYGERILINDRKPSGLNMSLAVNTDRNVFLQDDFIIDKDL